MGRSKYGGGMERIDSDDVQYLARETARRTKEELSSWGFLWTIAFRGTIAFGVFGVFWWGVWAIVAAVIHHAGPASVDR